LEERITEAIEWMKHANAMLAREEGKLLKPMDLVVFLRRGEELVVYGEGACVKSVVVHEYPAIQPDEINKGLNIALSSTSKIRSSDASEVIDVNRDMDNNMGGYSAHENSNENDDENSENGDKEKTSTEQQDGGFCTTVVRLRAHWKAAKALVSRLQNQAELSGFTGNSEATISEAELIAADLSESMALVQQAIQSYCLCRLSSHGEMIGCDLCGDWYHYSCVGITPIQAEKIEKYVCIRCALQTSFLEAARAVASLTNKWMRPIELAKYRESRRNKVLLKTIV
jgi:hypothetical protein